MSILSKKSTEKSTDFMSTESCPEKHFSPEEICEIIRVCSKSGVKHLELLELKVSFTNNYAPTMESVNISNEVQTVSAFQERSANINDEVRDREEDLSLLLIEDPVRYEELIKLGDLKDERT